MDFIYQLDVLTIQIKNNGAINISNMIFMLVAHLQMREWVAKENLLICRKNK